MIQIELDDWKGIDGVQAQFEVRTRSDISL